MNLSTKKITLIGMLCAMAVAVNLLIYFPIVPAVPFLSYDAKDVVIVIGGFMLGAPAAFIMSGIASVLELFYRGGTPIDVLMNMISTCTFACVAATFYKKEHTQKGAIKGLIVGVLLSTVLMLIWNYIITPIYYQMPREAVVALLLPGILPFNLLKNGLNATIALLLYKPIVTIFRHTSLMEKSAATAPHSKNSWWIALFIVITLICFILGMQGLI